jgi:uncharacterized surface anchored protein
MKAKCMLVLMALLVSMSVSHARSDRESAADPKVQASSPNPAQGHGSLTGTVTDESGKPVASATVELKDPVTEEQPFSVTTNEKGNYTFRDLLPGGYMILAKKDGKESDPVSLKVSNGPNAAPKLILRAKAK